MKGALFIFIGNITLGKMKSAMKHSAACIPPNQQINGKEGRQKRNDGRIALNSPTWQAQLQIFEFYAHVKTIQVIDRPVCCIRIWKNPLQSRG